MKGQVLFNGNQSGPFKISYWVKQGYVLAQVLFKLFFAHVLKQTVQDLDVYICYCLDGSMQHLAAKTKNTHKAHTEGALCR